MKTNAHTSRPRPTARTILAATLIFAAAGLSIGMLTAPDSPAQALAKADKLFKDQNWAEARTAYDQARELAKDWRSPTTREAVEGAVACSMHLQQWDDALQRAETYIAQTKGGLEEAIGEHFLAGLYMAVPHYGTKQGGKYLRGQHTQGVYVSSFGQDRKAAIAHYERARTLLIDLSARRGAVTPEHVQAIERERIGVNFDLANALAMRGPYGHTAGWDWWWSGYEEEEDSQAIEDADYEEPRWGGWRQRDQRPPTGVPLGPDGQPAFVPTPEQYAPNLGDGAKIRFLLEEVRKLDTAPQKNEAARALFRRAMIARSLYGPETANQWRGQYPQLDNETAPTPRKKLWELGDDEALTIVGGQLKVVTLPADESPLALLRLVAREYPKSELVPEAAYTVGLFYQSRQQFPEALREYHAFIETHPKHARAAEAQAQIRRIEEPGALLSQTALCLPDTNPKLKFTYRNCDTVECQATEIDLYKLVRDRIEKTTARNYWSYWNLSYLLNEDKEPWKPYLGRQAARWTEKVPRPEGHRVGESVTAAPLAKPGAYVVEARPADSQQVTRALVLVTDIAIVQKNMPGKGLIWLVDARTGQPLPNKAVRVYERWRTYDGNESHAHLESGMFTTNADGVIEYTRKHGDRGSDVDAIVSAEGGRMAYSFFQSWNENDYADHYDAGPRYYVITDRPVYRPGSTVKFRVWLRQRDQHKYGQPRPEQPVNIEIYDAKGNKIHSASPATDDFGGVSGEFQLGAEPPLGMYRIQVNGHGPDARYAAGGLFRVEEYRKPEFEVLVKPSTTQARLGDKLKARIEARYYFGAPVTGGDVTYKVFRENYQHVYYGAGEYDWLYGRGYGRYYYAYPWLHWWGRWGCFICCDGWWPGWGGYDDPETWARRRESGTRQALRDLVMQGTGKLAADGSLEIEIDTAPAKRELADRDHRYSIEVEVRDASRRTITGAGAVKVTRQAFYAFVEAERGWYQPGHEAFIDVRTLTPDNIPVAAKGDVIIYRIRYTGRDNAEAKEEQVKQWPAETDAEGRLSFRYQIPGEGQYRIVFKTRDAAGEEVLGNAVFWVAGPNFEGKEYRFNDLEIIADKRTYQVGETAHLLINTAANNSRILFSDSCHGSTIRNYRFIDLPNRSTVLDVPIEDTSIPNFFVEATLVRDGRLALETRELFVPPTQALLNVTLRTDKPTYKPGETGTVNVEVTDPAGRPLPGQVTLTAYDEAVTYIQDELGPSPKVFFHGQKRYHTAQADSSFAYTFYAWGRLILPQDHLHVGTPPEGWYGSWAMSDAGGTLMGMGAGGPDGRSAGRMKANATKPADAAPAAEAASQPLPAMGAGHGGDAYSSTIMDADGVKDSRFQRDREGKPAGGGTLVEAEVRSDFADTALWLPALQLGPDGKAQTKITFPQSLTTWRVRGYALTKATQVGDATAKAVTTKNLLVRLQSPRFFVERDEVVLSANVHNYLKTPKQVTAELIVPAALFTYLGPPDTAQTSDQRAAGLSPRGATDALNAPTPDSDGNLHLRAQAEIQPEGEHRFDWPVKAIKEGLASITVKALTEEESDAMRMAFPVLVHGINKTVAQSGSFRVDQDGDRPLTIELPEQIDPEQTRLEITLSPSLAGVMIDALPYLAGYPYGCTEQTMSRFYPSVLVASTLKKMGTDLETIGQQRKQMHAADLEHRFGRYPESPVFDSKELDRMVQAGLQRIYSLQHSDGGWGWWREDDSSTYQTAYILQGLHEARAAGVNVDGGVYDRGLNYLQQRIQAELAKPKNERGLGSVENQAFMAYALSFDKRLTDDSLVKWLDELYADRAQLNNYGRALLALTMSHMGRNDEAAMLLRNLLQFIERDDSNEAAWVRTPGTGWWFWWNNDIETNAWALRALVRIDPKNDLGPRLVKWLLNNRRNGYYWRSTRDTALTINAMIDFMHATGESTPEYALTIRLDGQPVKEVSVTKSNFFTFDNRLARYGLQVKPGKHEITITKKGPGALYYSAYLSYFTKEDLIKGAGNEIFVDRQYFKLVPKTESVHIPDPGAAHTPPAGRPDPLTKYGRTEQRATFDRVPLKIGDTVTSGEQIEVVLNITSKNVYDYLAFEDMKPAGCEPVELRSGGRWAGGLCANLELRDEKVVFFIGLLEQGTHTLRYRLRAETPGTFHALPTTGFAMYAPEVRAISDEMHLKIKD